MAPNVLALSWRLLPAYELLPWAFSGQRARHRHPAILVCASLGKASRRDIVQGVFWAATDQPAYKLAAEINYQPRWATINSRCILRSMYGHLQSSFVYCMLMTGASLIPMGNPPPIDNRLTDLPVPTYLII